MYYHWHLILFNCIHEEGGELNITIVGIIIMIHLIDMFSCMIIFNSNRSEKYELTLHIFSYVTLVPVVGAYKIRAESTQYHRKRSHRCALQ